MFEILKKMLLPKEFKSIYAERNQRGQTVWSIQNDEAYTREAFERIVWVYSCIVKISSSVSSVPWLLYKRKGNGELEEITTHPLLDLFNKQVNDLYTSADFFEMWAMYLACQGKFFVLYDNPVRPTELTPLHPHSMKIHATEDKTDTKNMVQWYEYREETRYSPNLILWDKFFDPLDFYDGLSPIRAGARTMDTENSAVNWNKDTFDNMGVPPGAIHLINAGKQTIEEIKTRWKKDYAGPKNARTPMVFDAEKMNYVNFGLSSVDMDFIEQRKLNRIEICSIFGVPGQLVGDPEGQTYANYQQAEKSFWTNTVQTRYLNKIQQSLNMNIVKKYDSDMFVNYDLSHVEALQDDEQIKIDSTRGLFTDNILTQNEAREELGYESVKNGDLFNYELLSQLAIDNIVDSDVEGDDPDGN